MRLIASHSLSDASRVILIGHEGGTAAVAHLCQQRGMASLVTSRTTTELCISSWSSYEVGEGGGSGDRACQESLHAKSKRRCESASMVFQGSSGLVLAWDKIDVSQHSLVILPSQHRLFLDYVKITKGHGKIMKFGQFTHIIITVVPLMIM